eukprot:scaffold16963_cov131-Isochrysis_galbana.AAC.1
MNNLAPRRHHNSQLVTTSECDTAPKIGPRGPFGSSHGYASPPATLSRRGGARTCATRGSISRVAREGVGFGVRVRTVEKASLPRPPRLKKEWGCPVVTPLGSSALF